MSRHRKYYEKNREKWIERSQAMFRSVAGNPSARIHRLIIDARWRAKRDGIEFDERICAPLELAPPTNCQCCDRILNFKLGQGPARRGVKDSSPSLDRKDNAKGYVLGNVFVICWRCNDLKGDGTASELAALHKYTSTIL